MHDMAHIALKAKGVEATGAIEPFGGFREKRGRCLLTGLG